MNLKKYGICSSCGYEYDDSNTTAEWNENDGFEYIKEQLRKAHLEMSANC